jgi:glyoxylase-like metal-dependent hydrolase (beta-lactamase superfamily II)
VCLAFATSLLTACASSTSQANSTVITAKLIAPGVFAFIGTGGEISPANQGRIANVGFIVGDKGVLVIDSGVSDAHGQALLHAIATVTDKPVKVLLVTHAMQEFLFGATAFQRAGVQLWMHERAVDLMKQRCNNCLKQLNATLGESMMRGTKLPGPDVVIKQVSEAQAQLSELIGRPITLHYYGHSSGPGDVVVMDQTTRVLFSGAMVESQRLPDTHDAKLDAWVKALHQLKALNPSTVVAGHGAVSQGTQAIDANLHYLETLNANVAKLVNQGVSLTDASTQAPMREYASWDQYANIHGQNVHRVYLEHERRLFDATSK